VKNSGSSGAVAVSSVYIFLMEFCHFSAKNLGFYLGKKNSSVDLTNFSKFLLNFSKFSLSKKKKKSTDLYGRVCQSY
jgi:hypothetical protein